MIGRVFRIVRTPLTLLILLGILCYGAWWGYTKVIAPVPDPPPPACTEQSLPDSKLKSSQVSVSVYNGGDRRGLAGDVGRALRGKGFRVLKTSNTGENIKETVIVGANAKNPEVILVKGFFKDSTVRADKRTDGTVDVLVGNKYGGFNKKAKTTIKVKGATACLPASQSPSPVLEN
ncbi:MAG: LytR C-terminal domain-containing protein [Microlunatus sp.]|nr:LytR C-terminal domain-containing protein [Microlunatus sp.]MDN5804771.1 LytR C-terminal domain-containing protein [Microlunatus sp.]